MKVSKAAIKIEREALRQGNREIDGVELSKFDPQILIVDDTSFSEHLDVHAAAGLYYEMILVRAKRRADAAKERFDDWHSSAYQKCNKNLMEESERKRPNIADVENAIKETYPKKYRKLRDLVKETESDAKVIQVWLTSWKVKSFTMDDRTRLYKQVSSDEEDHRKKVKRHMRGKRQGEKE